MMPVHQISFTGNITAADTRKEGGNRLAIDLGRRRYGSEKVEAMLFKSA